MQLQSRHESYPRCTLCSWTRCQRYHHVHSHLVPFTLILTRSMNIDLLKPSDETQRNHIRFCTARQDITATITYVLISPFVHLDTNVFYQHSLILKPLDETRHDQRTCPLYYCIRWCALPSFFSSPRSPVISSYQSPCSSLLCFSFVLIPLRGVYELLHESLHYISNDDGHVHLLQLQAPPLGGLPPPLSCPPPHPQAATTPPPMAAAPSTPKISSSRLHPISLY